MGYLPRVSIPSYEGRYERNLTHDDFRAQLSEDLKGNSHNLLVLAIAWTSLIADSPLGDRKPNSIINRFLMELMNDTFGIISRYTRLAHQLTLSVNNVNGRIVIDSFLTDMTNTPIFREYNHFYKTGDPSSFRFVMTFLSFGKKLYFENEEFHTSAFRAWCEVEERLGQLAIPPAAENLRDILLWVFRDWTDIDFLPKHGSGSVSEPGIRGIIDKNDNFAMSRKIKYLYFKTTDLLNETGLFPTPTGNRDQALVSRSYSRLKFVPKDWKISRSICMEPIVFQWAQQGVRSEYERFLSRCPLKNHVFIHDQKRNQQASAFGAKTSLVDTLDLSSASDCVSWNLVKTIFPPGVLKHLAATRTTMVQIPNGDIIPIRKYAPMGSGLCFPVQSTIFSAIVLMVEMAALYNLDWREPGIFKGMNMDRSYEYMNSPVLTTKTSKFQPFRCYGDDIICDKRVTSNVIEALSLLGFKVNKEKSFLGSSAYRESCGKHHLLGEDVTPFYFKVKKIAERLSIDTVAGLIDHANRALDYGYLNLRKALINICQFYPIDRVKQTGGMNPILFSNNRDDSFAILCNAPRNTHLITRDPGSGENSATWYQRSEIKSITSGPMIQRRIPKQFDMYRYVMWWRSRHPEDGNGELSPSSGTTDSLGQRVTWRWTPTPI